jgi:hypothetical protein
MQQLSSINLSTTVPKCKATLMMASEMELENHERMKVTGDAHLNPEVNSMMSKSSPEMTSEVVPEAANTDKSDEKS